MPLPEEKRTFNLEEVGAKEFWVTIKCVPGMKYGEMLKIFGGASNSQSKDVELERLKVQFEGIITDWNIEGRDGSIHPLPSSNRDIVGELPTSYINLIGDEILKDMRASVAGGVLNLPSGSETN